MELRDPPAERRGGSLMGPPEVALYDVLTELRSVQDDDLAKGLFLRLGSFGGAWGLGQEIREALRGIRDAGKPVHCHLSSADNRSYALAADACDRLTATPSALLNIVGVAGQFLYAKDLLDSLGLRAELIQIGRYKGAADPLTRREMPAEVRESYGQILDALQSELLDALVERRKLTSEAARAAIDEGPYDAARARALGLIDDVEFDDAAREKARQAAQATRRVQIRLGPEPESIGLGDLLRAITGREPAQQPQGPRVALVYVSGAIPDRDQPLDAVQPDRFVTYLRKLADDEDVRAIVLRIDSPGGSAAASDRMWHAVRRASKRKPVVASIGDLGASGGYYVASAARRILANEHSLVGSIGVVGGKVVIADLAQRVGLRSEHLRRGENAAWMSPFRPLDTSERSALERMLQGTYDRFIRRVSVGRDMERVTVLEAAEGRLMTGGLAQSHRLVDDLGGLQDALRWARESGGLPADAPVEIWPPPLGFLEQLAGLLGGPSARSAPAFPSAQSWALAQGAGRDYESLATLLRLLQSGDAVVAMAPLSVQFR